jgi:hypothetical protein
LMNNTSKRRQKEAGRCKILEKKLRPLAAFSLTAAGSFSALASPHKIHTHRFGSFSLWSALILHVGPVRMLNQKKRACCLSRWANGRRAADLHFIEPVARTLKWMHKHAGAAQSCGRCTNSISAARFRNRTLPIASKTNTIPPVVHMQNSKVQHCAHSPVVAYEINPFD